jgi:hypothetical protein
VFVAEKVADMRGTGRARLAQAAVVIVCGGALSACGFEEAPKPPTAQEANEAMQNYVADREGSTDSKGRYKGPRVLKLADLKCITVDEASRTYRCSFKYTVKRRNNEEETATQSFRKVPVKIEERGETIEKKVWQVVGK